MAKPLHTNKPKRSQKSPIRLEREAFGDSPNNSDDAEHGIALEAFAAEINGMCFFVVSEHAVLRIHQFPHQQHEKFLREIAKGSDAQTKVTRQICRVD
jgi:hypothetical protein